MGSVSPMDFGILGPLQVRRGTDPVELGGAKQRAVLAVLLIHANEVVSSDRLIDAVWADHGPADAGNALQVYVSGLRKALEPDHSPDEPWRLVVTKTPGYAIEIDAEHFEGAASSVSLAKDAAPWLQASTPAPPRCSAPR